MHNRMSSWGRFERAGFRTRFRLVGTNTSRRELAGHRTPERNAPEDFANSKNDKTAEGHEWLIPRLVDHTNVRWRV